MEGVIAVDDLCAEAVPGIPPTELTIPCNIPVTGSLDRAAAESMASLTVEELSFFVG